MKRIFFPIFAILALVVASAYKGATPLPRLTAAADTVWTWPKNPKNLQVLPSSTDADGLRDVMAEFTYALGVQCSHCHVTNDSRDPLDWDFAADDKPKKRIARQMIQMMRVINETHLDGIDELGQTHIRVKCVTCHRSQSRPEDIRDLLDAAYVAGGVDSVAARYREIRERYEGGFAFDLRTFTLARYAFALEDPEEKLVLVRLGTEMDPGSPGTWAALARQYELLGRIDEGLAAVERALAIDPSHDWAAQIKARLEAAH